MFIIARVVGFHIVIRGRKQEARNFLGIKNENDGEGNCFMLFGIIKNRKIHV